MNEEKYKILDFWPRLQEDLESFSKNPYKWLESELEGLTIPPESRGVRSLNANQHIELKKLVEVFKMVNKTYSPRLNS